MDSWWEVVVAPRVGDEEVLLRKVGRLRRTALRLLCASPEGRESVVRSFRAALEEGGWPRAAVVSPPGRTRRPLLERLDEGEVLRAFEEVRPSDQVLRSAARRLADLSSRRGRRTDFLRACRALRLLEGVDRLVARVAEDSRPLVWFAARRACRKWRAPLTEDMVAEGMEALSRAARKYHPDRGAAWSTYALFWIEEGFRREMAFRAAGRSTVSLETFTTTPFSGRRGLTLEERLQGEWVEETMTAASPEEELLSPPLVPDRVVRSLLDGLPLRERLVLCLRHGYPLEG